MINEIKRRLNIGETVELECIDWNNFSGSLLQRTSGRKFTEIVIESVDDDNQTLILDSGVKLLFSELKYFKIKDQMPTFNDLINVAVQAVRDGKIEIHHFHKGHIEYAVIGDAGTDAWRSDCKDEIEDHIEYIKSLYTETFVIESEEDIKRVKRGAEITLMNGSVFTANFVTQLNRGWVVDSVLNDLNQTYCLFILKDATVTQRKENESKY